MKQLCMRLYNIIIAHYYNCAEFAMRLTGRVFCFSEILDIEVEVVFNDQTVSWKQAVKIQEMKPDYSIKI